MYPLKRLISWWQSRSPQPAPIIPPGNGGSAGIGEPGFE